MHIKKSLPLIIVFILPLLSVTGQSKKSIDSLQNNYQSCLDKGGYMLGCAKLFYGRMDSMLNVVYNRLRVSLDTSGQRELKNEQRQWLRKRDAYFKKTFDDFKKENPDMSPDGSAWGAQDDAMFMYDKNAAFVKERVLELIKRLTN